MRQVRHQGVPRVQAADGRQARTRAAVVQPYGPNGAPAPRPQLTRAAPRRSVWHTDCFRCATCNCQLSAAAYAAGPEGEPYCLKHASKDARLSSLA